MVLVTTVSAFGELARLISDTSLPQDAARRIFNVIARKSKIDTFLRVLCFYREKGGFHALLMEKDEEKHLF